VQRAPLNQFAVERGWVRYEVRDAVVGFGAKASCPAISLTPQGEAASATWTRGRVPSNEGVAWAIPIGRREVLAVRELKAAPDGSTQVEFDWKWIPNQTGAALRSAVDKANPFFDQPRIGRASCRRADDGWECRLPTGWTTPADAQGEFQP
jgi:hypothetical protein